MQKPLKQRLYDIVFEADTPAGKMFDVGLLLCISLSIILVMLESVESIDRLYHAELRIAEWIITIIFTLEYTLRIYIVKRSWAYIFSFYGIIDLLSLLPTFLGIFISGTHGLMVIRALRLLRIFRIFKLNRFISESTIIIEALKASRLKIGIFLYAVVMIVIIIGTAMYLVEGEENGFTSIPQSIYWAIVTLTTVGYGDIAPVTTYGRILASVVMILGYAIIAVPTGIVTVELSLAQKKRVTTEVCPHCMAEGHDHNAIYCKLCGEQLNE